MDSPKARPRLEAFHGPLGLLTERFTHAAHDLEGTVLVAPQVGDDQAVARRGRMFQDDLGPVAIDHDRDGLFFERLSVASGPFDLDGNLE